MRELERQKKEYWAERERIREELSAEPDEHGPPKEGSYDKRKEGKNKRRRRLLFLLVAGMIAAFLFLSYSPTGNDWLARLTGATVQPAEEEQAPEMPAVDVDPQPVEEEPQPPGAGPAD